MLPTLTIGALALKNIFYCAVWNSGIVLDFCLTAPLVSANTATNGPLLKSLKQTKYWVGSVYYVDERIT
jgi:hypothetical protein